ncbi:MAG: hypothetical protein GY797_01530 [Deltaproteobacteria bacterium]|nr:hypothetical protein [Deltaproteobacteria bacterium]
MPPQKKVPIEEVCRILEIPVSSWKLDSKMSVEQAMKFVEEFKVMVKKQRKVLAKKYHPDKTGGDDTRIKQVNNMVDIVDKLEITKIPRRPQPQNVRFRFSHTSGTTDGTSSSFTGSFGGFRFYTYR